MIAPKWLHTIFKTPDEDKAIIQREVRQSNAKRALYITTGAVLCNLFFMLHFYFNVNAGTVTEVTWRNSIILLHIILLSIHLPLFFIALYINRTRQFYSGAALVLITAVFIILPIWGAVSVVLDQPVTSSIIAFFLPCAVCSMGLLMRPGFAVVFYLWAYIIFYTGLSFTQHNADLLLTNRVNGFACIAICCGVSILFWNSNIIRYRQNNLIEQQKKDIQSNYEKLLQSSQSLTITNAAKDKFFAIIAHDLRGPVTSTLALTQFINSGAHGNDPQEQNKLMQLLQNSLTNTAKLLENLLIWSRSQANSIPFNPVFLNIHSVVEHNIEMLKIVASEKDIAVQYEIDKNMEMFGDREMMNTVIRNLLSNALKFTNNFGKVTISSCVADAKTWQGKSVQISIQDNGVGIAENVLAILFTIDKKTTSAGTKNEQGTGLGLILCREFIEKHSGNIWAESKAGEGSCFTFELPVINRDAVNERYS